MSLPQIDPVTAAVLNLSNQLQPVASETLPIGAVAGRVLASPLHADRDNPPLDVSAMDGYALRWNDCRIAIESKTAIPICGVSAAGSPTPELVAGSTVQIFTGAPVPANAELIVPREQTRETAESIQLLVPLSELQPAQHIRRRGENATQGSLVLTAGTLLRGPAIAAVASLGSSQVEVYRQVKVAVINTGDELVEPGAPALDWQIRDSNGPTLQAMLSSCSWLEISSRSRVTDQLSSVQQVIASQLQQVDAVILTGGVSMGDTIMCRRPSRRSEARSCSIACRFDQASL